MLGNKIIITAVLLIYVSQSRNKFAGRITWKSNSLWLMLHQDFFLS